MLNTSFCRCKTLLKLSQSALSTDLIHKIDLRSYSAKVIYSSLSPHEKDQPKNFRAHEQSYENEYENEVESYDPKKDNAPKQNYRTSKYSLKKSYKPRNFGGQQQSYKSKGFNQQESSEQNYDFEDRSYKYKPRNFGRQQQTYKSKEFNQQESYGQNYDDENRSYQYKPRNFGGQQQTYKSNEFNQQESYGQQYDDESGSHQYKPKNFGGQQSYKTKKFNQHQSYKKNYGNRGDSYKAKNNHRNDFTETKKPQPVKIFDTNYAFLDNSEKIRIRPRNPLEEEEEYEDYSKPGKLYRSNYKLADNPSYSNQLSFEEDSEENESIEAYISKENESIEAQSIQVDPIPQEHSTHRQRRRRKYSFDSNLEFKEDSDDSSPLKLEILNSTPESTEDTTTCTVDVGSVDSTSSSTLIRTDTGLRPRLKTIDTPEGQITLNLADDEFDIADFVKEFNEKIEGPLDECTEDISYFGPDFSPTFNFAAYADKSTLIQQYVKLGVKLYKVEKNMDHMRALMSVDLEKELPMYIQFLHDCGIPAERLGDAITENPMILKEDLDDMKTRIRYLRAHKFTPGSIARIVTKNPSWLCWATKFIDERLGHFQNEFKLGGSEMRFLATKQPKLITYAMRHVNENTFAVKEQMGFNKLETKLLLLYKPRLWMNTRKKIVDSFDYLHNTMQLSHLMIASQADVLTTRKSRLKNRHEFLVELKKAQYDPKKPGYIAPKTMVLGSDAEFCTNVAKTAVDTYNLFLKTR